MRLLALMLCLGSTPGFGAQQPGDRWTLHPGGRTAPLIVSRSGRTGFTELPFEITGIRFTNSLVPPQSLTNHVFLDGCGVALGDVDGDGRCDIYLCRLGGPNALYRNLGGWKFEDVASSAGVACEGFDATSAALADLDGDGNLDLLVSTVGRGTLLFLNDGSGRFRDRTAVAGLQSAKARSSMALADVNGDGLLDLYVGAYRGQMLMDMPYTQFQFKNAGGRRVIDTVNGRPATDPEFANRFVITERGGIDENGEGGDLYLNQGAGRFSPVSFTGGAFLDEQGKPLASRPYDWELAAMFRDVNGDGAPDLYVCSDFLSPDRFWINDGKGTFRAVPSGSVRKTSLFCMGVDFADINRDGHDDFILLDMLPFDHVRRMSQLPDRSAPPGLPGEFLPRAQTGRNALLVSRGDGTYAELAFLAGVEAADWSWCPMFLDVDLDGWEDLLITNGNLRDNRDADWVAHLGRLRVEKKLSPQGIFESRREVPPIRVPNLCFRNRGDLTFEECGALWGFHSMEISHGMAAADLDGDGDLDVVVNTMNAACGIYRNDAEAPRITVRLHGRSPNTRGIGARIRVTGAALPPQQQEIISGGRYLSCDEAARTFAAGRTGSLSVEVFWRGGAVSRIEGVPGNSIVEVGEPETRGTLDPARPAPNTPRKQLGFFADATLALGGARHFETAFDDFVRQPLLPWKLSQYGPGVSWEDINQDGLDDLLMPSGRGGIPVILINQGNGRFASSSEPGTSLKASRDMTVLMVWPDAAGGRSLIAGSSSCEDGLASFPAVQGVRLAGGARFPLVPGSGSSTGPVIMADVDGDGDLDIFVGGRAIPGRYPEPASSRLLLATADHLEPDLRNAAVFSRLGLVSDAVFTDIDNDGDPDLVVALEWGPVRLFRNDNGAFVDVTQQWGLGQGDGLWNSVAIGDFDEDGRPDIVAGNWGRNTHYQHYIGGGIDLIHGDLSGGGGVDILEVAVPPGRTEPFALRGKDVVGIPLPFVKDAFATHREYASSPAATLLGDRARGAKRVSARLLDSVVLLNRGGSFERHSLPGEAQWSPVFGCAVGDLDGDGHEDVFLSQNFSALPQDRSRLDGGVGVWLRGDGRAGFLPVPPSDSGIVVHGEGRGAALADYDGDGRLDLAVAQNGALLRLFHNTAGKPGLRVLLKGGPGNPDAVGARLRWLGPGGQPVGPAREVRAGGGFLSRNSSVQVLASSPFSSTLEVRWPSNGKIVRYPIPVGAHQVTLDPEGRLHASVSSALGIEVSPLKP